MFHRTLSGTRGLSRTPRACHLPGEMLGASRSRWASFFPDTEEDGGSTPPALTTSADQSIYCSKESQSSTAVTPCNIPAGRPLRSAPSPRPDRPAPSRHLPGAIRPGAVRASAADASRVRRTVRPCCALGPLYGSVIEREGAALRRRGGRRSWRDRDGEDRGAYPLVQVEPDRAAHAAPGLEDEDSVRTPRTPPRGHAERHAPHLVWEIIEGQPAQCVEIEHSWGRVKRWRPRSRRSSRPLAAVRDLPT